MSLSLNKISLVVTASIYSMCSFSTLKAVATVVTKYTMSSLALSPETCFIFHIIMMSRTFPVLLQIMCRVRDVNIVSVNPYTNKLKSTQIDLLTFGWEVLE